MFFRRFFGFALVVILLLGMCGLLSSTAYRSGWSQGYVSGQTADGDAVDGAPGGPFMHGWGYRGPGPFSFFGWALAGLFKFLFFFFLISTLFRVLFWRRRGFRRGFGPWGRGPWRSGHWRGGPWGWHDHDHEGHHGKGDDFKGQRPPWYDDSGNEPVMKA